MKIGFIGLGQMGAGMAANLIEAGHELVVYNRTAAKAGPLIEKGAQLADGVAAACRAEVVVTMLADDAALERVVLEPHGMLTSAPAGATHLSMSTISVALSARLAEMHARAGQRFVAAPVFGRPEAAAAGKLFIVAAGAPEAIDGCRAVFDVLGQRTFTVGAAPQAANLVKLSGNMLIATVIESLGEAMALVEKGGVDRHAYVELLTSTLFAAPVYKTYGGLIAERKYAPAGFPAVLGLKDIRLTLAAAEALRVPLPLGSLLRDRYLALLAQGGEALDWSAIAQLSAQQAGLSGNRDG